MHVLDRLIGVEVVSLEPSSCTSFTAKQTVIPFVWKYGMIHKDCDNRISYCKIFTTAVTFDIWTEIAGEHQIHVFAVELSDVDHTMLALSARIDLQQEIRAAAHQRGFLVHA